VIELYMTVCLAAAPSQCKDVVFNSYDETVLPMQLLSTAQAEAAKWSQCHPGWVVSRYGTRRAGQYGKA
jgi:hypothetical protein